MMLNNQIFNKLYIYKYIYLIQVDFLKKTVKWDDILNEKFYTSKYFYWREIVREF